MKQILLLFLIFSNYICCSSHLFNADSPLNTGSEDCKTAPSPKREKVLRDIKDTSVKTLKIFLTLWESYEKPQKELFKEKLVKDIKKIDENLILNCLKNIDIALEHFVGTKKFENNLKYKTYQLMIQKLHDITESTIYNTNLVNSWLFEAFQPDHEILNDKEIFENFEAACNQNITGRGEYENKILDFLQLTITTIDEDIEIDDGMKKKVKDLIKDFEVNFITKFNLTIDEYKMQKIQISKLFSEIQKDLKNKFNNENTLNKYFLELDKKIHFMCHFIFMGRFSFPEKSEEYLKNTMEKEFKESFKPIMEKMKTLSEDDSKPIDEKINLLEFDIYGVFNKNKPSFCSELKLIYSILKDIPNMQLEEWMKNKNFIARCEEMKTFLQSNFALDSDCPNMLKDIIQEFYVSSKFTVDSDCPDILKDLIQELYKSFKLTVDALDLSMSLFEDFFNPQGAEGIDFGKSTSKDSKLSDSHNNKDGLEHLKKAEKKDYNLGIYFLFIGGVIMICAAVIAFWIYYLKKKNNLEHIK